MGDLTFLEYDDLSPGDLVEVLHREKCGMLGTGQPDASLRGKGRAPFFPFQKKCRRPRLLFRGCSRLLSRMRTYLQKAS
jgi:hypothetical protein